MKSFLVDASVLSEATKPQPVAATARQHNLSVATRNMDDYRHAGIALVNPLERR